MKKPKMVSPSTQEGETPFQRFGRLAKQIVSVPKMKAKKDGKIQPQS